LIERTIGVLKKRFPCLSRKLQFSPAKVGDIVVACCILHNLAIDDRDNVNENENLLPPEDLGQIDVPPPQGNVAGLAFRNALIAQHFQ
jgi:hypothetical protein